MSATSASPPEPATGSSEDGDALVIPEAGVGTELGPGPEAESREQLSASPTPRRGRTRWLGTYGWAIVLVIALLAVWEIVVRTAGVPEYLLPAPSRIAVALWTDRGYLAPAAWVTLGEVILGFGVAAVVGVSLALLLHLFGPLRRALYPLLIGSQTIPIVVLAPILVILLGYGLLPKLVIVALICFFPIVVNGLDGLRSVDDEFIRMMRTLHASRWSILRRVEVPSALPSVFSGLRIAATFAAIGAVFGEWSGSNAGLGYVMLQATPNLQTARIFGAVAILTAISLALFTLVSLVERLLVPWAPQRLADERR